jgi:hypothetical protein
MGSMIVEEARFPHINISETVDQHTNRHSFNRFNHINFKLSV